MSLDKSALAYYMEGDKEAAPFMERTEQNSARVRTIFQGYEDAATSLAGIGIHKADREFVYDFLEELRRSVKEVGFARFLWWYICNQWRDYPSNYE